MLNSGEKRLERVEMKVMSKINEKQRWVEGMFGSEEEEQKKTKLYNIK